MKIVRTTFVLLAAVLGLYFANTASADTIIMNDGKEVKGIVIEDYKDRILFSTPDGEMTIMKSDIRELAFDSDEDNLVKLAGQAIDRKDYSRAMAYYDMALKANPNSTAAKQGMAYLQGTIFRKEESRKVADIKRQEDIEKYGGAGITKRNEADEVNEMVKTLTKSTGITIVMKDSTPTIGAVKRDSPAYEAGVRKGDRLVSVWDKLTGYLSLKEALDLLINRSAIEIRCVVERTVDVEINPKTILTTKPEDLIGVTFTMELDGLTISALKEDGPAIAAGLAKGDLVMAIDGAPTRYMPLKKAIELIKRSDKAAVELTIRRKITIWRNTEL